MLQNLCQSGGGISCRQEVPMTIDGVEIPCSGCNLEINCALAVGPHKGGQKYLACCPRCQRRMLIYTKPRFVQFWVNECPPGIVADNFADELMDRKLNADLALECS